MRVSKTALLLLSLALFVLTPVRLLAAPSCSFLDVNGTLTDFGVYVSGQAVNNDAVGSVRLNCSDSTLGVLTVTVMVSVDGGQTGNIENRALSNGIDDLFYGLYTDINRSNLLGDGSGTSSATGAICPNGTTCDVLVYGRAFGGQYLSTGNYADDVVVTVDF